MYRAVIRLLTCVLVVLTTLSTTSQATEFQVSFPDGFEGGGRLLLLLSKSDETEPRFQVRAGVKAIQIFGTDVDEAPTDSTVRVDESVFGYPLESLRDIPSGEYFVQAVFHRYEVFSRSDGHTLKLPMDRGEGQQWNKAPGNLYSTPKKVILDSSTQEAISVTLDQVIPPIEEPTDTEYVKHIRIQSRLLSEFWGRPMFLGAHILVPHGFEDHPDAHYPLMVFHGHFPSDLTFFRTTPPDEDLECEYSERFRVECYNRIQQQEAFDFYKLWTGPDFPRFLVVEIQHANPYYDDSYAVNSANLGPYGDAITYELISHIEKQFRGLGEGWARFLYGGSTGGWEALAAQVFYPEEYNGAFAACPDPIDFRAYVSMNIYEEPNAFYYEGPFRRVERPGYRDWLGTIHATIRDDSQMELALATHNRSGQQYDIWEAVFSPTDSNGYPKRLWDRRTGVIDPEVAEFWRDNFDLRFILERDWPELGPKLEGKIHIFTGDMDNFYLNNAVYLMEDFLESTTEPYYGGEVDYGDRAEHCWNGDHLNGNHISRLRYNTMYLERILERIESSAPEGADLTSWRY